MGVLGNWYANLVNVGPARWILCQSERSLPPVLLPARNEAFPAQFGAALGEVLHGVGVRHDLIEKELGLTGEAVFSRTANRQVLGAMNDFAYNAQFYLPVARGSNAALEVCLMLSDMPSKPINYESPGRLTLALFQAHKI